MENMEQNLQTLFNEVQQELERQILDYQTEINEQLQAYVPAGDKVKLTSIILEVID